MTTENDFMIHYMIVMAPFAEKMLTRISEDYKLPLEEMKIKFLYDNKKVFNKMVKKYKVKKKRKIHPYNIFLSDKSIINNILKDNNTDNQTEINRQKGEVWKTYKKDPKVIKKYKDLSTLENNGLLLKKYREDILLNWSTHEKTIKKIMLKQDKLTLEKTLKMLKL